MSRVMRRLIIRALSGGLKEIARGAAKRLYAIGGRPTAPAGPSGPHPLDVTYGVDTSGAVFWREIGDGRGSALYATAFVSSQPSIIRQALRHCPDPADFTFIDLGAGKGRAVIVASEYPFRKIIGVEISRELHAVAARNALTIAETYPQRPKIEMVLSDAVDYPYPIEPLIIFIYHPFLRPILRRVIRGLERSLREHRRDVYLIYINPELGHMFDRSPCFDRYFDAKLSIEPAEAAHAGSTDDRVTIWRSRMPAGARDGSQRREQLCR